MVIAQYDTYHKDQSMLTLYGLISKGIVSHMCGFLKCSHKYMALFKTEYSNMPQQLAVP